MKIIEIENKHFDTQQMAYCVAAAYAKHELEREISKKENVDKFATPQTKIGFLQDEFLLALGCLSKTNEDYIRDMIEKGMCY